MGRLDKIVNNENNKSKWGKRGKVDGDPNKIEFVSLKTLSGKRERRKEVKGTKASNP